VNAEQIRAEAIEVMARTDFEECHRSEIKTLAWEWGNVAESMRAAYRRGAARAVDALAAAGLLPTIVEKQAIDGGVPWTHSDGGRSALPIYGTEQRYVTEWREVTE